MHEEAVTHFLKGRGVPDDVAESGLEGLVSAWVVAGEVVACESADCGEGRVAKNATTPAAASVPRSTATITRALPRF